jgi:hypothetical protein
MPRAEEDTVVPDPKADTFNITVSVCGLLMAPEDVTSIEP